MGRVGAGDGRPRPVCLTSPSKRYDTSQPITQPSIATERGIGSVLKSDIFGRRRLNRKPSSSATWTSRKMSFWDDSAFPLVPGVEESGVARIAEP
jgi:hypothetical protein